MAESNNVDKMVAYIKTRKNLTTEQSVRDYLSKRIQKPEVVETIIKKLFTTTITTIEPEVVGGVGGTERAYPSANIAHTEESAPKKEIFVVPSYKKAIAQFFQRFPPMPRARMKMEMSFKLDWFTPSDADTFISFCMRDGLLKEEGSNIAPTFDPKSVELLPDWSLHAELGIKTGREVAEAERKKSDNEKDVQLSQTVNMVELSKMSAEDGIEKDNVEFEGTGDEHFTLSHRNEDKLKMVKSLVGCGIPPKVANGLFDYYELNKGIADFEMFHINAVQFEKFTDEKLLKKGFQQFRD